MDRIFSREIPKNTALDKHDDLVRSICTKCSLGCNCKITVKEGRLFAITGGGNAPNNGQLCEKGADFSALYAPDRITAPLRRDGDSFLPLSWEEALSAIAEHLKSDHAAVVANSESTNEELALCAALSAALGGKCRGIDAPDFGEISAAIDCADVIAVVGCNPAATHPVIGTLLDAAKERGAKITDSYEDEDFLSADAPIILRGETAGIYAGIAKYFTLFDASSAMEQLRTGATSDADEALYDHRLSALLLLGGNPASDDFAAEQLGKLSFLAVGTTTLNETAKLAHIVLPLCLFPEKQGTFRRMDGTCAQLQQAVAPPNNMKTDFEILSSLLSRLS